MDPSASDMLCSILPCLNKSLVNQGKQFEYLLYWKFAKCHTEKNTKHPRNITKSWLVSAVFKTEFFDTKFSASAKIINLSEEKSHFLFTCWKLFQNSWNKWNIFFEKFWVFKKYWCIENLKNTVKCQKMYPSVEAKRFQRIHLRETTEKMQDPESDDDNLSNVVKKFWKVSLSRYVERKYSKVSDSLD